jgi:hypothetical protein
MAKKAKVGKIALVVFITVLIWVWADRALDEHFSVPSGATLTVAKTSPDLWVSFGDRSSIQVTKIILKGPVSKIADVKRGLSDGSLKLEFFLEPEQVGVSEPGEYTVDLLGMLKRNELIRKLGVTVETCQPGTVKVKVTEMIKKKLKVNCVDSGANPVTGAIVTPSEVEVSVPTDFSGTLRIQLNQREIEQARLTPVKKTPYLEIAGRVIEAPTPVQVSTPSEQDRLQEYLVTATLGISISPALQGKYKVEVANLSEVISPITIRATPEAKAAYEMQQIPTMTLYIVDADAKAPGPIRRAVVYNFPPEFVRTKDIELKSPKPVEATFNLVPITPEKQPVAAP